jgi:hypothetical protein
MLKTILEKEKTTLIYQDTTLPFILGVAGVGDGLIAFFLRNEIPLGAMVGMALSAILLWAIAYTFFQQKFILILDQNRQTLEEYLGAERQTFEFKHIDYADVDRVREQEAPQDEGDTISTHSPHLNYHPFLQLKSPAEKYFLFDRKGRGIGRYREARLLVEATNQAINVPKDILKTLNVYQMKSKGETPFFYPLVVVVLLGIIAYLLLSQYGYL